VPPPTLPGKVKEEKTDEGKAVEFKGMLRTGIMAIGGETTGTIISVKGKTYELDFRNSPKLRALAEKLNRKEVVVKGTLQRKEGIEIPERWIIMVTDLLPAEKDGAAPAKGNDDADKPASSRPAEKDGPVAPTKIEEPVRKIAVTVDPLAAAKLQGTPGVTAVSAEKQLKESFGEDIAKQITGKVDFVKEDLVHVSWGSSGPPFGDLRYDVKDGKITFFIKEPKAAVRGQAYRLGNDFFAVPKGAKVKFGGTR
jgi:hypothetical protein